MSKRLLAAMDRAEHLIMFHTEAGWEVGAGWGGVSASITVLGDRIGYGRVYDRGPDACALAIEMAIGEVMAKGRRPQRRIPG